MDLKETYNKIAVDWHKDHDSDSWWVEATDKFISFLNKGALVLDAGCGAGTKTKYLLDKGLRVVGTDFSEKMIEIAKEEAPGAEFFTLALDETGKLNYMFDGIFMQAGLLHIPKKEVEPLLKKVINKLKAGGYLYIAVKEQTPGGVAEEVKNEKDYGFEYERFFSYFTFDDFAGYFKNLGIEMIYKNVLPPSRSARQSQWIQIIGRKI